MSNPDDRQSHWQRVHQNKEPHEVSWFQSSPIHSIELIEQFCPSSDAAIIDVGGGISRLVDTLVERGRSRVTVLDVSETALSHTRARLGDKAALVNWIHNDILHATFDESFQLWHDRAVFHFLIDSNERRRYVDVLFEALAPGGHAIIATFAPDGPDICSGLPVARYSADSMHQALGPSRFSIVHERRSVHVTPQGKQQRFQFGVFRRS